jgi:hypothetical protein
MAARDSAAIYGLPRIPRLFLHFFDVHFIEERQPLSKQCEIEIRRATRLAVGVAEQVFLPASSFYESDVCRRILPELDELFEFGCVVLSGSAPSLSTFIDEHREDSLYRPGSLQHKAYASAHLSEAPPYQQRRRSATADIVAKWNASVENDLLPRLFWQQDVDPRIEKRLKGVPDALGDLAFTPEHVFAALEIEGRRSLLRSRLRSFVNEAYFGSFTKDVMAGTVHDLIYLQAPFLVPSYSTGISYRRMIRLLHRHDRLRELDDCSCQRLLGIAGDPIWQAAVETALVPAPASQDENGVTLVPPVWRLRSQDTGAEEEPLARVVIHNLRMNIMGDQYKIGQAGAVGPGAHAHDMTFAQHWLEAATPDKLTGLADDLARLRDALTHDPVRPETEAVLTHVTSAERAAREGDGKGVLKHLASAGKWALDTATAIGAEVAAAAIKAGMGLP